ncbi:hypothetical protein JCM9492_07180 [Aquifex pyrophilus]
MDSVVVTLNSIIPFNLQSDILIRKDANRDGICDYIAFQNDYIVAEFKSSPKFISENITYSPVYVYKYVIEFYNASPQNKCEKNPTCRNIFSKPYEFTASFSIQPPIVQVQEDQIEIIESIQKATVLVIPSDWKEVLMNYCYDISSNCIYNVKVKFHAIEIYSGKENELTGTFTVQFGDFPQGNSMDAYENIISTPDDSCILF